RCRPKRNSRKCSSRSKLGRFDRTLVTHFQAALKQDCREELWFMANHAEIVSFIWGVADLIRDSFKRGHYQDVILPFTVLRRIDAVLAPTKQKVLESYNKLKGKLDNLDPQLCKASGFAFYNTSKYDFDKLLAEPQQLAANLRRYINGFSKNMRDVI